MLKVVNANCRTNNAYLRFTKKGKKRKKIKSPGGIDLTIPAVLTDTERIQHRSAETMKGKVANKTAAVPQSGR